MEGGVNSEIFHEYLSDFNPPNNGKKNVLIMDNLSVHKVDKIAELLASKGIEVIFLPPYTPELNPIEKMNNIIKQHARSRQARDKEKLDSVIEEKIKIFKEEGTVKYLDSSVRECIGKLISIDRFSDLDYRC